MGAENYKPDAFLETSMGIDTLFAELELPITPLGETVVKQHLQLVPDAKAEPKTHEQQAAEYFGRMIFGSPLRPAS